MFEYFVNRWGRLVSDVLLATSVALIAVDFFIFWVPLLTAVR